MQPNFRLRARNAVLAAVFLLSGVTNALTQHATTTSVSSSLNPSSSGEAVTFTATVSDSDSGARTGTVTFMDGAVALGHVTVNTLGVGAGVAAGASSSCALTRAGGVKCWGLNRHGQLGNTTNSGVSGRNPTPAFVDGFTTSAAAIAMGVNHTCALTTGGGIQCWGVNSYGQLGNSTNNGTDDPNPAPAPVAGLISGVAAVAVGQSHTCALTSGGGVKCWGQNWLGQLGNSANIRTDNPNPAPADVEGLTSGVIAIAVGANHTCALTGTGGVKCWGYNANGQLGNSMNFGTFNPNPAPADVDGLTSGVVAIAAGYNHTCALIGTGRVKCWGWNMYGQLGNLSNTGTEDPVPAPTDVDDLTSVVAIAVGLEHTCALTSAGGVKCWGGNWDGQLGNSTNTRMSNPNPTPTDVDGLTSGVVALTLGASHTCALTSVGAAKCWGSNVWGELGDNFGMDSANPVPVNITDFGAGTATFNPSALTPGGQTVNQAPVVTSASSATFTAGTAGAFTITTSGFPAVTSIGTSDSLPGGIFFTNNGDGTATLSGTPAVGGTFPLTITASNGIGSNAEQSFTLTVDKLASTVTLAAPSQSPSVYGQPVTFSATVNSGATGSVTFKAGATTLGTGPLVGNTATVAHSTQAVGSHSITAVYNGDGAYNTSTSSAATQVIDKASTTTTLTATPATARPGQAVKLTATVSANAPSTATTTGTVTFKDDTKLLGNVAIVSGKAILNTTDLEIGANGITAGFAATANFNGSGGAVSAKVSPKLGPEFLVNTMKTNAQQTPAIARLAADAFVVVWASNLQDGSGTGIYGQRYKNNGAKSGVEFRVNTMTAGAQSTPAVAPLQGGGFVVAWTSAGQDRSGTGIIAQRYSPTGAKAGAEFVVNTTTAGNQSTPAVAGFGSGGFVIAWASPDGEAWSIGIYAQRYDATGNKVGKEFRVNTKTWTTKTQPAVATLATAPSSSSGSRTAGRTGSGIYGQRYKANGAPSGAEFLRQQRRSRIH